MRFDSINNEQIFYSLCPIMSNSFDHFKLIKKKYINEREREILIVKYSYPILMNLPLS
jgi:hypothetical protein